MKENAIESFDKTTYCGYLLKGNLTEAMAYVEKFPEKADLYQKYLSIFEREQYLTYDIDSKLNGILLAYQQYYRDAFYLSMEKNQAADKLKGRLAALAGVEAQGLTLDDLEDNQIAELFQRSGLHFLGGVTSGYYGPYVWKTTETVSYEVELPDGIQTYTVKFLDGFFTRSWLDYLSFGETGTGGWAESNGIINCVRSVWDVESEDFQVSLLKHEAQHARDLAADKNMPPERLEYRAKLVELIYSRERNLLKRFAREANPTDKGNSHAAASYWILQNFAAFLGVKQINPDKIPMEQIQTAARALYKGSF